MVKVSGGWPNTYKLRTSNLRSGKALIHLASNEEWNNMEDLESGGIQTVWINQGISSPQQRLSKDLHVSEWALFSCYMIDWYHFQAIVIAGQF